MPRTILRLALATALLWAILTLVGCGGEDGPAGASVPVTGTVVTAPFSLESVSLTTSGPRDWFEADRATARIERADGTSADVDLSVSGDGRTLTLGPAAVTASSGSEGSGQAPTQADVRVLATIQADTPGRIDGISLVARDAQDTFDITGARAYVDQADGGTADVALDINADGTEVTLGSFPVEPPAGPGRYWKLNHLTIQGPVWVTDGATDTRTQIGSLGFTFGAYDGDGVIAPTTVRACIPTLGVASDRRVVCEGLDPTDYVWVAIEDIDGGVTYSRAYFPDENGQAVVPDTLGQFTAERISGPNSGIEVCFANTERYAPPPVAWPPVPDNGGPGGENGSRLNVLVIGGPLRVFHGGTERRTELGHLRLGVEVLDDGSVVAPATFALQVPVTGVASDPSIDLTGLQAGDFVQTRLLDRSGIATRSALVRAAADGRALVPDAWAGKLASALSGPAAGLSLFIARTDTDGDGHPDAF
jgi:hypothetical protein